MRHSSMGVLLLLLAPLAVAQEDRPNKLRIRHFQVCRWFGGPPRNDLKFVPHEQVRVSFQVAGLQTREDKLNFEVKLVLLTEDKPYFEEVVSKVHEVDWFGKNASAGIVYFTITDEQPGPHKARLELTDKNAGKQAAEEFEFEVVPPELKVVNFRLCYDNEGSSNAPAVFQVFQPVVALFDIVGLKEKQGSVDVTGDVNLLDAQGRKLHGMNDVYAYSGALEQGRIPGNFRINAGVPGEYQLEVVVRDKNGGKPNETRLRVPIRIVQTLEEEH